MSFTARLYDEQLGIDPRFRAQSLRQAAPPKSWHHVIVHNLSTKGLLVESYHEMHVGSEILVELPDLGLATAHVAWHDRQLYDCDFETPLPVERVQEKLRAGKVIFGNFPRNTSPDADVRALLAQSPFNAPKLDKRWSPRVQLAVILAAAALCWLIPTALYYIVTRPYY